MYGLFGGPRGRTTLSRVPHLLQLAGFQPQLVLLSAQLQGLQQHMSDFHADCDLPPYVTL
jgi:hypothetical protein